MSVTHVVSFSGGRTSAYLVHLMEQRRRSQNHDRGNATAPRFRAELFAGKS